MSTDLDALERRARDCVLRAADAAGVVALIAEHRAALERVQAAKQDGIDWQEAAWRERDADIARLRAEYAAAERGLAEWQEKAKVQSAELARLTQRVAEEQELRRAAVTQADGYIDRAEAAEQRVAELEQALTPLIEAAHHLRHCRDCGECGAEDCTSGGLRAIEAIANAEAVMPPQAQP